MTEENDLMSEFRKLQSETTGIRSLFSDNSSIDVVGLTGNKLAKDIHDFCEKTIELNDRFNKEVMKKLEFVETELKNQRKENSQIRSDINGLKKAVEESRKDMLKEIRATRSEQKVENKKQEETIVLADRTFITENGEKESTEKNKYRKEFEMKKTFKNILESEENELILRGEAEEHYGIKWCSGWFRRGQCSWFVFVPLESKNNDKWEMEAEMKIRTVASVEKSIVKRGEREPDTEEWFWSIKFFFGWDDFKNNYLIDGGITIEINIRIDKINGVYEPNRRNFDESMKEFSDVVLGVGGRKFYLYKLLKLSSLSPYFKKLHDDLLMNSENREVLLDDRIDPDDFQVFLEVLYDEPVDETTVEICLLLAGHFQAETIIRRCEEFLIEKSQKSMEKKLQMAIKYKLDSLKKSCISELKTAADVREAVSVYPNDMDQSLMTELFYKLLSFNY